MAAALQVGILLIILALALSGCSRKIRLNPLPAAKGGEVRIRVQLTYDRNDQIFITVNGPDPSAYGSQYTRYVAWVATPDRSHVTNVGQIRMEGTKGEITTLTPLRKFHLFLTVEEKGDTLTPGPLIVFQTAKEIDW